MPAWLQGLRERISNRQVVLKAGLIVWSNDLRYRLRSPQYRRSLALYFVLSVIIVGYNNWGRISGFVTEERNPCEAAETASSESKLSGIYSKLLNWVSRPSNPQVAIVSIPLDLAAIQLNTCTARSYMADLLFTLAKQHPAAVVIDKYFGVKTCLLGKEQDANTKKLVETVEGLSFPVILGEASKSASVTEKKRGVCLVPDAGLPFESASKLRRGLLRPNADLVKIPLQWSVPGPQGAARQEETLAMTAFRALAPDMVRAPFFQHVLATHRDPYVRLQTDLPQQYSTALLCGKDADTATRDQWCHDGNGELGKSVPLLGKIVVIGAEDDRDKVQVLGTSYWGFELQANYLSALLTGSYLLAAPWSMIAAVYLLFLPVYFAPVLPADFFLRSGTAPGTLRSELWPLLWAAVLTVVSGAVFLLFHWLPPLGAYLLFLPAVLTQSLTNFQSSASDRIEALQEEER